MNASAARFTRKTGLRAAAYETTKASPTTMPSSVIERGSIAREVAAPDDAGRPKRTGRLPLALSRSVIFTNHAA